jgi:predicted membrane-bound spermidine synthase
MVQVGMPPLPLLVFVIGTGSLGAEIAAVRLLSPYFGASTIVWANTIGVVLVALSLGYWLGGRWADRNPTMRGLCKVTLAAAALLALVPFAADPLLDVAVEALDDISAGAFLGSLVAVLVLVAVPVLLLGAVSPWALRLAVERVEHAGEVAGRLYALSTAGSLFGTLVSALLLIPLVGTRRTFLLFALAIAIVAVWGLRPVRRYAAAPAAIALLIALPVGTLKASDDGKVIYEKETPYQYARVVEDESGKRRLELNEGQAEHSVYEPYTALTGDYWDGQLVLPFAVAGAAPRSVAILGNAAGTASRAYERYFPEMRIDGVEIDSELSEIGRRFFDMNNPRLELHHEDARPFLRRTDERYDVLVVDAYRQPYIPFYLTTREFFELCRDRLADRGVVIVNVGHPEDDEELEKVLGATMAEEFPYVMRDPIERTNTLLVAGEAPISAARLRRSANSLPADLRALARTESLRLGPRLEGGDVYTDDRAPVEWLVDKSIVEYAAGD